jgi:hypothetical protein
MLLKSLVPDYIKMALFIADQPILAKPTKLMEVLSTNNPNPDFDMDTDIENLSLM